MSETRTVRLGDYCHKIEKITSKNFSDESFQYVDLSSIDNKKKIITRASKILTTEAPSRAKQLLKKGDILVSTVRPNLNAVAVVPDELDGCIGSTGFSVLRPTDELDPVYLFSWVCSPTFVNSMANLATGASYPAISDRVVKDSLIPLPPLEEQKRIAAEFTLTRLISQKRERQQELFEELKSAVFHDLFGAYNENVVKLGEVADITAGITKGRKTNQATREVPYLAVANVQSGFLKLDNVKTIEATEAEIEKYRLQKGDIILTEGGDPDKLGRGTVWNDELPEVIHQNHIFRVRLHTDSGLTPEFVEGYLSDPRARKHFLRSAKQTTGIASINKTQLSSLTIPIPQSNFIKKFNKQNEVFKNI
ncbi:restriction endonuclease subunit S [Rothia sp. 11273D007AR]